MKISKKEFLIDVIVLGIIILLIMAFQDFILKNLKVLGFAFLFFGINYLIILSHERKYGKKNFPYKKYQSKEKTSKRILTGLLAGVNYLFFIGSYDHKKYNTQVWHPETIECVFGNISQFIILFVYLIVAVKLFEVGWYYYLLFLIIPIITNLISLGKK